MITLRNTPQGHVVARFTDYDLVHAGMVGFLRQAENTSKGRQHRDGFEGDAWGIHINGAIGEAAVACYLDRWWSIGKLGGTDVNQYQVRTRMRDDYDLILHPRDPSDQLYFLVTAVVPDFTIRGWLLGIDGKQQRYWKDPAGGRPAFFVPQSALRPLAELKTVVPV